MSRRTKIEPTEIIIEEEIAQANGQKNIRKYSKGRFLGKGGFARVYELTCLSSKKLYAGKIIAKSSLTKPRAKQKLMSEIKIHRSLSHTHVVSFEHFFEDSQNVYLLLELCTNQTMSELLRRRKRLTELEVQCYMLQIISSLKYAHSKQVLHRDLKVGNLFLNEKMEIKLGDFGLASKLEYEGQKRRTVCGTPNYIAPEVLEGKQGHSYEADCWSLGVVMYTLLVGKPPFETNDVKKTYNLIKMNAYSFPECIGLSEQAKGLITRILRNEPSKRLNLTEIRAHEFFHMGNSIPRLLPVSTLAVPPSENYRNQYLPRSSNVIHAPMTDTAPVKSLNCSENRGNKVLAETQKLNLPEKGTKRERGMPKEWVRKWVDYSAKYGLGYTTSSGSCGVSFNDSTKLILEPKKNYFYYIEKAPDSVKTHHLDNYPKSLQKKVTLLQHFKSYLEYDSETFEQVSEDLNNDQNVPVYVKKWVRTKRAILFRLSNHIIQVSFQDKSEILLSTREKSVTYISKIGERVTMRLSEAFESSNGDMSKRLKYTKDILDYMTKLG